MASLSGHPGKWSARARTRRVNGGGKEKDHRHRIESEQTDRSLEVSSRRTDQLSETSHRPDIRLGAPALGVNFGFLHL